MTDLLKKAAISLREEGCYTCEKFISKLEANSIVKKVKNILGSVDLNTTKEYENFIVGNNFKTRELKGPPGQKHKPVILTRGLSNFDYGLIEIFQAEKLIPEIPTNKISAYIKNLMKEMGIKVSKIEYSVYSNNGGTVSKVRGYHRDIPLGGSKFLNKLFVYLTDVPDISYGPHSYIHKSHLPDECMKLANHLVGNYEDPNEYDCALYPEIFLGKSGTMIITTQDGLHRGLQQEPGKERIALVCKIRK